MIYYVWPVIFWMLTLSSWGLCWLLLSRPRIRPLAAIAAFFFLSCVLPQIGYSQRGFAPGSREKLEAEGGGAGDPYSAETECTTSGPTWTRYGDGASATGGCQAGRVHLEITTTETTVDTTGRTAADVLASPGADGLISLPEALMGASDCQPGQNSANDCIMGPRLVTSAVSGDIFLDKGENDGTYILQNFVTQLGGQRNFDDLTIDFGDAPDMGLQIRTQGIGFHCDNVLVRYVRIRTDGTVSSSIDNAYSPGTNIVWDHISSQWGDDGNFDVSGGGTNITLQFSIIGENFGPGGILVKHAGLTTNYKNLLYNLAARYPEQEDSQRHHSVNNVYFRNQSGWSNALVAMASINCQSGEGHNCDEETRANYIKNYFKPGASEATLNTAERPIYGRQDGSEISPVIYLEGNVAIGKPGAEGSGWRPTDSGAETLVLTEQGDITVSGSRQSDPGGITEVSATQAYADLITNDIHQIGVSKPCRDNIDQYMIDCTESGDCADFQWLTVADRITALGAGHGYPDLTQDCPGGGGGGSPPVQPRTFGPARTFITTPRTFAINATPGDTLVVVGFVAFIFAFTLAASRRRRK